MVQNTFGKLWNNLDTQANPNFRFSLVFGSEILLLFFVLGLNSFNDTNSYLMNIFTEGLSIGITVFIIDRFSTWRNQRDLYTLQVASQSNEMAKEAISWITYNSMLAETSSILTNGYFKFANWSDAVMWKANLEKANLEEAQLVRTRFADANLNNANLRWANCRQANFRDAKLQNSNLYGANLDGTRFLGSDLTGANLERATITKYTEFYEDKRATRNKEYTCILPDKKLWTQETDMTRFTDPDHPDFWRNEDDPESPAYRGKNN